MKKVSGKSVVWVGEAVFVLGEMYHFQLFEDKGGAEKSSSLKVD